MPPPPDPRYQRSPTLLFVIILCAAASQSITILRADSHGWVAAREIGREPLQEVSWQRRDELMAALAVDPARTDFLAALGRLYEDRALVADTVPQSDDLQTAHQFYQRAVAERPATGRYWAAVAQIEARLGTTGASFTHAMAQATTLAPFEPEAHHRITDAGFHAWATLPDHARQDVIANTVRGLESASPPHRQRIADLVMRYAKETTICPHLPRQHWYHPLCK